MDGRKRIESIENIKQETLKEFLTNIREHVDPRGVIFDVKSFGEYERQIIIADCKNYGEMTGSCKLYEVLTRASYPTFHEFLSALYKNKSTSVLAIKIATHYTKQLYSAGLFKEIHEIITFCELTPVFGERVSEKLQTEIRNDSAQRPTQRTELSPIQRTQQDEGKLYTEYEKGDRKSLSECDEKDELNIIPETAGSDDTPQSTIYTRTMAACSEISIDDNRCQPMTIQESDKRTEQKEDNIQ